MKSRSPQFFGSGGMTSETWLKLKPWSVDFATLGYHCEPWATMNAAYTLPSGPTTTAGSHALRFDPIDPGRVIAAPNVRPPSVERAKPIFEHPIQSSYT